MNWNSFGIDQCELNTVVSAYFPDKVFLLQFIYANIKDTHIPCVLVVLMFNKF